MASTIKGITIEIAGNTQPLNKALGDVNKNSKSLSSELKQVERLLKLDPKNTDLLAQRQRILAESVQNSKDKLSKLKDAQAQVNQQFKEGKIGEDQYRAFQREVVKGEQDLRKFETQLKETSAAAKKLKIDLKSVGSGMKNVGSTMSAAVTAPLVGGFVAVTQGTKELRRDLSRLEANAQTAGQEMGILNDAMAELQAVTGETDSSVEGLSNLMSTGFRDEQLTELLDSLYGASIKFSDTLKFEGISDGLQETLATGAAIGPFAELLERSGVALDGFNEGLTAAITNGTQEEYVLEALAQTGLAGTYEAWKKQNEEMVKAEEANFRMQQSFAELGATLEPILTPFIRKITELADRFNEMDPAGQKVVLIIAAVAAAIGPILLVIGALCTAIAAISAPVAIAVAAVAGLIAIGIALWRNWDTIREKAGALWDALVSTFEGIKASVGAIVSDAVSWGRNIVQGIIDGITGFIDRAVDAASNLADKISSTVKRILGIASPSAVMREFGRYVAEGLALGMEDGTSDAEKAAQKMAQAITGAVQVMTNDLNNNLSLSRAQLDLEAAALSENASEAEKLAIEMKKLQVEKGVVATKAEVLTAAYEAAKDGLGENNKATKQYAHELTMAQIELQKTEISIQKTNIAIRKQAQAAEEAASAQVRALREVSDEIDAVELKYRNELVKAAEEYQEKVRQVNDGLIKDERRVTEEYERELNNRADALSNFVGLFDAVTKKEISGNELLENLRGQVEAFDDWQENIAVLSARGVDEGLVEELRKMGPKAGPEIAALNTLTDEQLNEYVSLWRTKNRDAREEAIDQLRQQRVEMRTELQEIRIVAAEQLEAYRVEWEKKNTEIRKNAEGELKKIQDKFDETAEAGTRQGVRLITNFASGMESQFDRLRAAVEEARLIAGDLDPTVRHSPSLVDNVKSGLKEIYDAYQDLARKIKAVDFRGVAAAGSMPAMAGTAGATNNYNNSGGNTFNITVQDGEDLMRTLRKLGVVF